MKPNKLRKKQQKHLFTPKFGRVNERVVKIINRAMQEQQAERQLLLGDPTQQIAKSRS